MFHGWGVCLEEVGVGGFYSVGGCWIRFVTFKGQYWKWESERNELPGALIRLPRGRESILSLLKSSFSRESHRWFRATLYSHYSIYLEELKWTFSPSGSIKGSAGGAVLVIPRMQRSNLSHTKCLGENPVREHIGLLPGTSFGRGKVPQWEFFVVCQTGGALERI